MRMKNREGCKQWEWRISVLWKICNSYWAWMTSIGVVIEEALRYIGGYTVKKFCVKYRQLGQNNQWVHDHEQDLDWWNKQRRTNYNEESNSNCTWTRSKGGKDCLKRIVSETQSVGGDLPNDIMNFFDKIYVLFRMTKLKKWHDNK